MVVDRIERNLVEELSQLALVLGPEPDELLELHARHEGEGALAGPEPAGGGTRDARHRALEGGERHGDPLRAVAELVAELVERLVELVGAHHLVESLALLRHQRRPSRSVHLAEIRIQERGAHALFPRLRPRPETLGQPGLAGAGLEPAREGDLRGVGERAQHAGHVLEGALLQATLGERPRGLALEVQDGQAVRRPEELAEMVVAVDADLHDVAGEERVQAAEPLLEPGAVAGDALRDIVEGGRQTGQPGRQGFRRPAGLGAHRVPPGRDVTRVDRLGRQGVARRGRAQRAVQAAGERADPGPLVGVGRREGAGEHGVRRFLLPALDRRPVVLDQPLEHGRPRVALVRDELVQHGQRRRLRAVGFVGDGAGEPGRPRKGRPAGQEVRELELRARPGVEAPEELEDGAAVVDDRRVALLTADRPALPGRARQDLRQGRRRGEAEGAGSAGKGHPASDGFEEGQAERRDRSSGRRTARRPAPVRPGCSSAPGLRRRRGRRTGRPAPSCPAAPSRPRGAPRSRSGSCCRTIAGWPGSPGAPRRPGRPACRGPSPREASADARPRVERLALTGLHDVPVERERPARHGRPAEERLGSLPSLHAHRPA